jgi:hypothetical protein
LEFLPGGCKRLEKRTEPKTEERLKVSTEKHLHTMRLSQGVLRTVITFFASVVKKTFYVEDNC